MPIYEYKCLKCNEKFSALQSIHFSEKDTRCPGCSSNKVKKAISAFSCVSGSGSAPSPSMTSPGVKGGG